MISSDLIELIRDRFDSLENKLDSFHQDLHLHIEKDERYWKKLDEQEGQLRLIKYISGVGGIGTLLTAAGAWIYKKLLT